MRIVQQMIESVRRAGAAIVANKLRGGLTTLGIVIGVVAVDTTMTAVNGLANNFARSVAVLGSDVLYVSRMPWVFQGTFFTFRNRPPLTVDEAEELERRVESAVAVNPTAHTFKDIKFRSTVLENMDIVGTTDRHMLVSSAVPELGRFLTAPEVRYRKFVCVIGSDIRDRLFEDIDPINKTIKIGRFSYRVIGVMEKQGGAGMIGGPNFDAMIYIPIHTMIKAYGGERRDFDIAVRARSQQALEDLRYQVIGEMRKIRRLSPAEEDNFTINQMDTLVGMFNNVMGVVLLIGMLITGIALFVGGVGVMNIMFVSVTERTREIGIRKALGAQRSTILVQYLCESAAICLFGGLLGLLIALGVTELIDRLLLPASISPPIVAIAIVVSIGVGVVAGLIPAVRAARLNPIEALRYE
ncbi:MAG: ABC transporter permease [Acidobacteriota bacterium]|nr:MAG: ABC transporter permease [Acidobacteriota bacterium]